MLAKVQSAALLGLNCELVEVETDLGNGFPGFTIVGLPDSSIQESKERIKAAIKNSGLEFPATRHIVVNLAPADIPKEGPSYDLALAVGILLAQAGETATPSFNPSQSLLVGELALDGALRRTQGVLPITIFAKEKGIATIFIPETNLREASLIEGVAIIPVKNLKQLFEHIFGQKIIQPSQEKAVLLANNELNTEFDMSVIKGQEHVKRALEIAAAGAHNLLMTGPPGSGKTLLARTFPTILPPMTEEEVLELTKIYSVAGLLPTDRPLITERPFRSPHHTASNVALIGGGRNPRPGEISLAHRGVLFLDELPEFTRQVLESLRQPLEDGLVTVARARGTITFPARFSLIASQNPCPCGYAGDREKACSCSPSQAANYRKKISGPLLDRIDLHVEAGRVDFNKLADTSSSTTTSTQIRERVGAARQIQRKRFKNLNIKTNSEMLPSQIKNFCQLDTETLDFLRQAMKQLQLSGRSFHRLLKVSRTIADLDNAPNIELRHTMEALQYRPRNAE